MKILLNILVYLFTYMSLALLIPINLAILSILSVLSTFTKLYVIEFISALLDQESCITGLLSSAVSHSVTPGPGVLGEGD